MNEYVLKEYYIRYLREVRELRETSIKHYLDAIRYISKFLVQKGVLKDSLYEIYDIEELDRIRQIVFEDTEFISLDKRGHQMYSSGLNNYYRFADGTDLTNESDILKMDIEVMKPERTESTRKTWRRSSIIKNQAIVAADYKCEIDNSHLTFITKSSGSPYMEGHHVIPMNNQDNFDVSLDVYANVICLCPICHRLLHYGEDHIRQATLNKVYSDRSERLAKCGIRISIEEFNSLAL